MMSETEKSVFIVDLFVALGEGLIPYTHFYSDDMKLWVEENRERIYQFTGKYIDDPLEMARECLPHFKLMLVNETDVEDVPTAFYGIVGGKIK